MAVFTYTALDRAGRRQTGTIPADTRAAAMDEVLNLGLSPISLEQAADKQSAAEQLQSTSTRVSGRDVENFTRELANLLAAGLPLSKALYLLRREVHSPGAKNVWGHVHDDVVGGDSLAEALAQWPKAFSPVYVAMVRAGEAGGFLHVVLQQIADFRAREQELMGRVKAAMVYPIVLACLAVAVLVFLLTFFIPRFRTIFDSFGGQLPWLTLVIIRISETLVSWWGLGILAVVLLGVYALRRATTTEGGRRFLERTILRTPAVGHVAARFALVRFCRMLGTLTGAGVPLVASLRVAKEALGNQTLADTVAHAIEEVQRGTPLSRSLGVNPLLFPPSVVEMIAVAEETGKLDKELVRLSQAYEGELDRRLRMLVSLAEPVLLLIMAGLIGTVVIGMLLPVFNLQDLMANQ
jgi:type II secretory pathway component PulF